MVPGTEQALNKSEASLSTLQLLLLFRGSDLQFLPWGKLYKRK